MKNRKTERKNDRKVKKMKTNLYFINKNKSFEEKVDLKSKSVTKSDEKSHKKIKINNNFNKNKLKMKSKDNLMKINVKQKRDIFREEKEIKRLAKKLKLNKRKKSHKSVATLPKAFTDDGLDYILEVIDSHKQQLSDEELEDKHQTSDQSIDSDNQSNASEVDSEADEELNEEGIDSGLDEEADDDINEEVEGIEDNEMDSNESDDGMDSEDHSKSQKLVESADIELKEDIYGFIRDRSGNIVKQNPNSSEMKATKDSPIDQQLLRRIRGQLNRLTVNNVLPISQQFVQMFRQNSRHDVNEGLFSCINSSLIDLDYSSPQKLTTEISILISILNTLVGDEVGGHVIHSLIVKLNDLFENPLNESKRADNLVLLLINLFVCGLIESTLVYEMIAKLSERLNEKCIELIDLILRSVGFILRKENAIKMKEIIIKIQTEAKNVDKSSLSGNRIRFLLDSLIAIKNNNMSKFKGYGTVVDVDLIETTLKSTVKKPRVSSIAGSYEAILQSSHWYSYTQNMEAINSDNKQINEFKDKTTDTQMNDRLFKALRLNTPLRKSIVLALSTCNDYIDASHRLISLAKKQFTEVTNVLIHVCLHEKQFNPFYSHLLRHLSQCDRKYKIALDFSIRDRITDLESLEPNAQLVLSALIFELLKLNALAITCLKVVHFADMNQTFVAFIKRILSPILEDRELIEQILSKIPNKDSFATAIRLFISCFIETKHKNKLIVKRFQNKN